MIRNKLKWIIISIFGFLCLSIVIFILALNWNVSKEIPQVTFFYSAAFDNYICSSENKTKILPAWHAELKNELPKLQALWNKEGTQLLSATIKEVGKPFPTTNYNVATFLCPNLPGVGFPILIPVRMYLKSAVKTRPWPKNEFIDMVYHEILHLYIIKNLKWYYWLQLFKKYSAEDFNTKLHLHLFALQKSVYLNLGWNKDWQIVAEESKQLPPAYSRAIEIIDRDGYQSFVEELKH